MEKLLKPFSNLSHAPPTQYPLPAAFPSGRCVHVSMCASMCETYGVPQDNREHLHHVRSYCCSACRPNEEALECRGERATDSFVSSAVTEQTFNTDRNEIPDIEQESG